MLHPLWNRGSMPGDLRQALASTFAGRYLVERELGRGGMATVYLVHDTRHDRSLALKVLHPQLAAFLGRERFAREIAVASRLTHPNILPLHDSGEADGLLFYLMPYVEGETLRDRMVKEHPLPLEDALRIARDVAEALAYAHDHNVVHRDIKPSNILLQAGAAIVADFGIARAIRNSLDEDALTDSGLVLGTPAYMSPEQASAEEIDGRSDIYSLGCVLYEMLAGGPPFSGASGRTLLARHSLDPVPPLRTARPSIPVAVERAVMKALEKAPADRYASAAEFAAALRTTGSHGTVAFVERPARRRYARRALIATVAIAGAGAGWLGWQGLTSSNPDPGAGGPALDTSRYMVFPLARDSTLSRFDPTQVLQDAIARWQGVSVVDQFQVRDALARRTRAAVSGEQVRRLSIERGAGRYIRGEVSPVGDSLQVHAVLYDATAAVTGPPLAEHSVRLGADLSRTDSVFAALADALLFRGMPHDELAAATGTKSLSARQAFANGQAAIQQWNLAAADSHFANAIRHDGGYPQALLWTALVRAWSGQPVALWRSAAERAAAGRAQLASRDQGVADAVLAFARGDLVTSCRTWTELASRHPGDFVTWYGSGNCQSRDSIVLPDRRSPSGWRFRSSYTAALRDYQRAVELLPSIHEGLSADAYEPVRRLFMLNAGSARLGVATGSEGRVFMAYPTWIGDTLALTPFPLPVGASPSSTREAVRHQRELFHDIASAWVASLPQSASAAEAQAFSMELLGQPGALQALQRARSLATDQDDGFRLAASEAWLRVKISAPADPAGLRVARRLADSLLLTRQGPGFLQPLVRASLAALTGRARTAGALADDPIVRRRWGVPNALAASAPKLLVLSAMGGPPDSLRSLESQVTSAIEASIAPAQQVPAGLEWVARSATLAFPAVRLRSATALVGQGDYLLDAMEALARGDTTRARRALRGGLPEVRSAGLAERPADALYPEAWLMSALGDNAGATTWLDKLLESLYGQALNVSGNPVEAGSLVRAMALRAELAARVGDSTNAARWARTVVILWSDADDWLRPLVRRMEELAR